MPEDGQSFGKPHAESNDIISWQSKRFFFPQVIELNLVLQVEKNVL